MRNVFPLFAMLLLGSALSAGASEPTPQDFERSLLPDSPILGERGWSLQERMRYYHVPGAQVAVVRRGKLVWSRGYGLADPRTKRRVGSETLFDTGSISKAVTTLAVLRLVEQGKLTLDAPVNTYLRSWKLPESELTQKSPVTLRRLLSHTAGVSVSGFWGYREGEPQPTLVQILNGEPPATNGPIRVQTEPGTKWGYSGGGYVIVQQVIEDVTRKPFAEALEALVLRPLGMRHSSFVQGLPIGLRRDVAQPTSEASYFSGKRLHPHAAAAGLYATATDLALCIEGICRSLRGEPGAFLQKSTAQLLIEPVIRDREPWDRGFVNRRNTQKDQALGFMGISRSGAPGETVYSYHDGINAGFRSRMIFDPKTGEGVVILLNSDGDEELLLEMTRSVAATNGWKDFLPEPIRPQKLTAKELERYVGRYKRGDDNIVTIYREGDHLLWTDLWTRTQPIYPIGNHAFEHRALFGRASKFESDAATGQITGLDGWKRLAESEPKIATEFLLQGELERGAALLRQDSARNSDLFNIGFNLLETHGNAKAAVQVFQVGVERAPGVSGAWDALGDALKRAGARSEGDAAERRAATLRAYRDRLTDAFMNRGTTAGLREYRKLRDELGVLPLGDMLTRLSQQARTSGREHEAEVLARLDSLIKVASVDRFVDKMIH